MNWMFVPATFSIRAVPAFPPAFTNISRVSVVALAAFFGARAKLTVGLAGGDWMKELASLLSIT